MPDTFDSKQYSWSDVTVVVGGRIITGCQSVEYTIKQEKSILRGRGNAGHRILRGNKDNEGKLEVWQSVVNCFHFSVSLGYKTTVFHLLTLQVVL